LEKQPARSITKSLENEEERTSTQNEASNEEVHSKKGSKLKNGRFLSLMIVE